MSTQANIERGMAPEEAHRVALRDLGGVTQTKEGVRDVRTLPFVEHVIRDVRGAFRRVKREPGFAAAVVVTIGLAVGLATIIFAVAAGVLLRPLPFDSSARLVQVWKTNPTLDRIPVSVPDAKNRRRTASRLGDWHAALDMECTVAEVPSLPP